MSILSILRKCIRLFFDWFSTLFLLTFLDTQVIQYCHRSWLRNMLMKLPKCSSKWMRSKSFLSSINTLFVESPLTVDLENPAITIQTTKITTTPIHVILGLLSFKKYAPSLLIINNNAINITYVRIGFLR